MNVCPSARSLPIRIVVVDPYIFKAFNQWIRRGEYGTLNKVSRFLVESLLDPATKCFLYSVGEVYEAYREKLLRRAVDIVDVLLRCEQLTENTFRSLRCSLDRLIEAAKRCSCRDIVDDTILRLVPEHFRELHSDTIESVRIVLLIMCVYERSSDGYVRACREKIADACFLIVDCGALSKFLNAVMSKTRSDECSLGFRVYCDCYGSCSEHPDPRVASSGEGYLIALCCLHRREDLVTSSESRCLAEVSRYVR